MVLEFKNGQQIDVIRIIGGPRLIHGAYRDTLSIEIDPNHFLLNDLRVLFSDYHETEKLYTYQGDKKILIGEGYMILVSCSRETRKVETQPGLIVPPSYEDINIVNIAQLTYDEYQSYLNGNWNGGNNNEGTS